MRETLNMNDRYRIAPCRREPALNAFDDTSWKGAHELKLTNVFPQSSSHRPDVCVKLMWNAAGIYGIYRVDDCFVRAVHLGNQAAVCLDSCVEFFVWPEGDRGYHNFEMNCGGSLLSYWIRDARRTKDGFADYSKHTDAELAMVKRVHSLPERVEPEIAVPTVWTIGFFIPFAMLKSYGMAMPKPGSVWRGGFFKCADQTSHPHWISWLPIPELNYHRPDCFGKLVFE